MLTTFRERSIAARVKDLQLPDVTDPARIRQGAGNYNAMCTGCHLAPGMEETELSKGLYPAPPNLTQHEVEATVAVWFIKIGRASCRERVCQSMSSPGVAVSLKKKN